MKPFHHSTPVCPPVVFVLLIGAIWGNLACVRSVSGPRQSQVPAYSAGDSSDLSESIRPLFRPVQVDNSAGSAPEENVSEEIRALTERVAANPEDADLKKRLGDAYLDAGRYVRAFDVYQQVRGVLRDRSALELSLAEIWYHWGFYKLAGKHVETALRDHPSFEAWELLGRIHLQRSDARAARAAFLKALELQPRAAPVLANVGYTFVVEQQWPAARDYLQRALANDPGLVAARNNLGVVWVQLNEPERAILEFLRANPLAAAFNNLGCAYLHRQSWRQAEEAFLRALEAKPDYRKAKVNLAYAREWLKQGS